MRTIPQHELRNKIGQVLREVEAGERLRITVDGRPVADIVPIDRPRRTFVPRDEVLRVLSRAPLDPAFEHAFGAATGSTIDEL